MFGPEDLPDLPDPLPEDLPHLDKAWHVVSMARWSPLAKMVSCNVLGLSLEKLKTLIGPAWHKVYDDCDPTEDEPLPGTAGHSND